MRPFAHWVPAPLAEALQQISTVEANQWSEADPWSIDWRNAPPRDYLIGVGQMSETTAVARKLATNPKMKPVWEVIGAMTPNQSKMSFTWPETGIVSCAIARRCSQVIHAWRMDSVTKKEWSDRHRRIAAAARELSDLMQPGPVVYEGFGNLLMFLTPEDARSIASAIYGTMSYQPTEERARDTAAWVDAVEGGNVRTHGGRESPRAGGRGCMEQCNQGC